MRDETSAPRVSGRAARAIRSLRRIVVQYRAKTKPHYPSPNGWRRLRDDDVWRRVVSQVSVVGSAASGERLLSSREAMAALRYSRLVRLGTAARAREIHRRLRTHGVRYVTPRSATCAKTRSLVRNLSFFETFPGGPAGYICALAALPTEEQRIARVSKDLAFVKLKGARDLLAEIGLAKDVIALDARVLGVLRALGMDVARNVTSSPRSYAKLEALLLREVCAPERVTGVVLDRILFWNAGEIRRRIEEGVR